VLLNRSISRVFAASLVGALAIAGAAIGQSANCGILQGNATTGLPSNTGTLPPTGDLSLGGGTSYLYVLTQWGFARSSLANPANPAPYSLTNVGLFQGNGGVVQINCDCQQAWNSSDVAEGSGGTSRMIGDWLPYDLDSTPPLSGQPAQLAQTTGGGSPTFGQQIFLPDSVPQSSRVAALYVDSTQKYFGYFPVSGSSVHVADLTNPTGSAAFNGAIQPTVAIGWNSGNGTGQGVRLKAMHVSVPGYDKYLLVGSTVSDLKIHVAEINASTGTASEVASGNLTASPVQLDIGIVNGRIFIFSGESTGGGLRVYEFQPPNALLDAGHIAGDFRRVAVRGPAPFPILFGHRYLSGSESYIDIYDTKWLTQGGTPLLGKSLRHIGATDAAYRGSGFEALVEQVGGSLIAYLYREISTVPQQSIHTDKVDISCLAADPTAPPIANALMTNLSAVQQGRSASYFGDKWELEDASVSYQPLTNISWDINSAPGSFLGDAAWSGSPTASLTDILPAYWPCEPISGGDLKGVTPNCWSSLDSPQSGTYYLGLKSTNINGQSAAYFSGGISVSAPPISIVGYNGNVLQVLAGTSNNGDASASQGNTAEATFTWAFTPSGTATGMVVSVPSLATAFTLTAAYKGGFSVTKSGAVQQVDLVPNFSATPTVVLINANLALRNLMQIGGGTSLNFVDWAISTSSTPPSPFPAGQRFTCPTSFCNVSGTTNVAAPSSAGNYYVHLAYNFSGPHGGGQQSTVSMPFTATSFSPSPSLVICQNTTIPCNSPAPFLGSYLLTTGSNYHLSDGENLPGGVTHPGSSFWQSSNGSTSSTTGDTSLGTAPGAGPVSFSPATCTSSCFLKIEVPASGGAIRAYSYTATTITPPPPPSSSLSLSGPSSGTTGTPVTFTAVPSGFTPTSYSWDFGDAAGSTGGGGDPCPPVVVCNAPTQAASAPGPNPNTYTYVNVGTHTVSVTASNGSTTKTASRSIVVTQGGPPPPPPAPSPFYTIAGAALGTSGRWEVPLGQTVTFTAVEAHAASWIWNFGDGTQASGRTVTHAFTQLGSPNATLTVTGDGTNTDGTSNAIIEFTIVDPSVLYLNNRRFEIRSRWVSVGQGTSGVGTAVGLTADTGYFWFFYPANLEVVVKVLDACSIDGYFWVFGGGLTNLGVELTVLDTQTGAVKTYSNAEGTAFLPIQDTRFEPCPAATVGVAAPRASTAPTVTLAAASPANPAVGDTVIFTATPADFTGTVGYRWDFGDGAECPPITPGCSGGPGLKTGPNPNTHVFTAEGTYTVTVEASAGSQTATATQSVTVSPVSTTPRPSSAYTIAGATAGRGAVWSAPINQTITFTASETHAASWEWDFGAGVTELGQSITHVFTAAGNPSVTLRVTGDGTNTEGTSSVLIRFDITDPYTLLLDNGRFAIQVAWSSVGQGTSGLGTAAGLTSDTGYFWFFNPSNTEVVIKVLDACSIDGHFWIFGSGLTNLGVVLTVTDTQSGTVMTYTNPDGSAFLPIQDFASFSSCGGS